jgi:hypothetical protein
MCFVWIWEKTAIISLYSVNWLVFMTETESVYCAVRTGSLYIIRVMCFVWFWEQTAIISPYSINWMVCVTETDSASYCTVCPEHLYRMLINFSLQRAECIHLKPPILFQVFLKITYWHTWNSAPFMTISVYSLQPEIRLLKVQILGFLIEWTALP